MGLILGCDQLSSRRAPKVSFGTGNREFRLPEFFRNAPDVYAVLGAESDFPNRSVDTVGVWGSNPPRLPILSIT